MFNYCGSRNFTCVITVAKAEREDPLFGLPPLSGTRSYRVASDRRVIVSGFAWKEQSFKRRGTTKQRRDTVRHNQKPTMTMFPLTQPNTLSDCY
ncbi:Cell division control protein 25 [Fusarium oxysporum f. sp. albedinis]|nr:Cell division control protein 25 [Fusarium oxysporum f. sp. albedinis]